MTHTPSSHTPIMQQYLHLKKKHPNCLLFFRLGDFYEMFFEDAMKASSALNITLTRRRGRKDDDDIPMCGVPVHSSDIYMTRLMQAGFRVAICEQLESPLSKSTKGPLKRDVVRILTPGTLLEDSLLQSTEHNFLVSIASDHRNEVAAFAVADISTDDFWTEVMPFQEIDAALTRLHAGEILVDDALFNDVNLKSTWQNWRTKITLLPSAHFNYDQAHQSLLQFFNISHLLIFGAFQRCECIAAGVLVNYLKHTHKQLVPRIQKLRQQKSSNFMQIDSFTRRNLELTQTLHGENHGSLLHNINITKTPQGSRLLTQRLSAPLCHVNDIQDRLSSVSFFYKNAELTQEIRKQLHGMPDVLRCITRLQNQRGGPRDLQNLAFALKRLRPIKIKLDECFQGASLNSELLAMHNELHAHQDLHHVLSQALKDEHLPLHARDGGFIAGGFHSEFDAMKASLASRHEDLESLTQEYIDQTGIHSLKIKRNNIIGYYIEFSATHAQKVPDFFQVRQTLVGKMRYTTQKLNEFNARIVHAETQVLELEKELFQELVRHVHDCTAALYESAHAIAVLDVCTSLSTLALDRHYVCPTVDESFSFCVQGGRHPVIENIQNKSSAQFIPNDCQLEGSQQFYLLTGPNMAGKSTFLRQNALIALLAHIGSFVPASKAHFGVIDKIFSRVGASDDLAHGKSTFMVEMTETATILHQATARSLVIVDEIGRGTSTYDGLSIAWACLEHLADAIKARTLFATHYHELNALENYMPSVTTFHMNVQEWQGKVIFLYTLDRGGADASYGIHVARLAGLPHSVVERADVILNTLHQHSYHLRDISKQVMHLNTL